MNGPGADGDSARAQLSALAQRLALASPAEGAGVLAAAVVELTAALCESIARTSLESDPAQTRGAAVQSATLRARAATAGAANASAYARARELLEQPASPGETGRDAALRAALIAAADTLLAVAALAGDCAGLAAELVPLAPPGLRADAAAAAQMAAAAAAAGGGLVEVNLALLPDDERRHRAQAIVEAAAADSRRARAAVASG